MEKYSSFLLFIGKLSCFHEGTVLAYTFCSEALLTCGSLWGRCCAPLLPGLLL
jgi:hypothetical protein